MATGDHGSSDSGACTPHPTTKEMTVGIFNRRRPGNATAAITVPGRRLSSTLSVADCEEMFRRLSAELGGYAAFTTPSWTGNPADQPHLLLAADARGTAALYLAVWERGASRELNIVPATRPEQLPPTMIGAWKMQDSSLSSTGTVNAFPVA
jgi:hypothetical protein